MRESTKKVGITKPMTEKEELDEICRVYKLKMDTVSIDLSFKHLGDKGAQDIAKFIEASKAIKQVNLSKRCWSSYRE
jgi:Ran GTPase-activating protein (RanGAP) involved in mRNA processing and transport